MLQITNESNGSCQVLVKAVHNALNAFLGGLPINMQGKRIYM